MGIQDFKGADFKGTRDSCSLRRNQDNRATKGELSSDINLLAAKDHELNTLLQGGTSSADSGRHKDAINRFHYALAILYDLDPDHEISHQWAFTYESIGRSGAALDQQHISIHYTQLAIKEHLKEDKIDAAKIVLLCSSIIEDLQLSDSTEHHSDIADTLFNSLSEHWNSIDQDIRATGVIALIEWSSQYRNGNRLNSLFVFLKSRNFEVESEKTFYDAIKYIVKAQLYGLVNSRENESWSLTKASSLLERFEPVGPANAMTLKFLCQSEKAQDKLESAYHAINRSVTAIVPQDPRSYRLLCDAMQEYVDLAICFANKGMFINAHQCCSEAFRMTEEHADLFTECESRINLQMLRIEMLFKEANYRPIELELSNLAKEIALINKRDQDQQSYVIKYLSYRAELAYINADYQNAEKYFARAITLMTNGKEHNTDDELNYRFRRLSCLRQSGEPTEALHCSFEIERHIEESQNHNQTNLAKIRLEQGILYSDLDQPEMSKSCFFDSIQISFNAIAYNPTLRLASILLRALHYCEEFVSSSDICNGLKYIALVDKGLSLISNLKERADFEFSNFTMLRYKQNLLNLKLSALEKMCFPEKALECSEELADLCKLIEERDLDDREDDYQVGMI